MAMTSDDVIDGIRDRFPDDIKEVGVHKVFSFTEGEPGLPFRGYARVVIRKEILGEKVTETYSVPGLGGRNWNEVYDNLVQGIEKLKDKYYGEP